MPHCITLAHERKQLGNINIDISFDWRKDYWDHEIIARASVYASGRDTPLTFVCSTGSVHFDDELIKVRAPQELERMWSHLTRRIMKELESEGLWVEFPGLEQENEVKPCPFQAKD